MNIIVHSQDQINDSLSNSEYFFIDIIKEGIELYKLKGAKAFVTPRPLNPQEDLEAAEKHFEYWMPLARHALKLADTSVENNVLRDAAFLTHQAVERMYHCALLVLTNYSSNSHNIKNLRSQVERLDPRFIEAWPRETKRDRRLFELLKRAYVEARYSEHYTITKEELQWLRSCGDALSKIVDTVSKERIADLTEDVKKGR